MITNRRPRALRMNPLARAALLALGAPALLCAGPVLAQSTPAGVGELSTVTVTANRRVEDQQKVGVSVTALNGERLAERNITDLSQIEGISPGFTFGRSGVDAAAGAGQACARDGQCVQYRLSDWPGYLGRAHADSGRYRQTDVVRRNGPD